MTCLGSPQKWETISRLRAEAWHWTPANIWPRPNLLSHPSSCCESREALTAGRQTMTLGPRVRAEAKGFGFP